MKVFVLVMCLAAVALGAITRDEVRKSMSIVKQYMLSDEGIEDLREYARGLQAIAPHPFKLFDYLVNSSKEELHEFLSELLKNIPNREVLYSPESDAAFRVVAEFLLTDEGIAVLRTYAKELQSEHPVVNALKDLVEVASDQDLKANLRIMFANLD